MTLTTHILVGAAAVTALAATKNPAAAFGVALASHYLLDIIPHWSYRMPSVENLTSEGGRVFGSDKIQIVKDLAKTLADLTVGTLLLFFLVGTKTQLVAPAIIFWGLVIIASVLPDALQGVGLLYKGPPVRELNWLQNKLHYDKKGAASDLAPTFWTISSQLAIVLLAIAIII